MFLHHLWISVKIPKWANFIQSLSALHLSIVYYFEICHSLFSAKHPSVHPPSVSSGLLPWGSWDTSTPWGWCFHSLWEKHSRENSGKAAALFLCLLDVTIMEICISEKRHSGPLGPKKYKYFNNKHAQCLPPVMAPGYCFVLSAVSQRQILYA